MECDLFSRFSFPWEMLMYLLWFSFSNFPCDSGLLKLGVGAIATLQPSHLIHTHVALGHSSQELIMIKSYSSWAPLEGGGGVCATERCLHVRPVLIFPLQLLATETRQKSYGGVCLWVPLISIQRKVYFPRLCFWTVLLYYLFSQLDIAMPRYRQAEIHMNLISFRCPEK